MAEGEFGDYALIEHIIDDDHHATIHFSYLRHELAGKWHPSTWQSNMSSISLATIWLRVWLMILGLAAYLLMSANGAIGTGLKIK